MTKTCYYEVLGLEKGASADEIKKAYRAATKKYHPDIAAAKGLDPEEAKSKMSDANVAHSVLKDEKKKAAYDRGGFAALEELENGGTPHEDKTPSFHDMFTEAFGKAGAGPQAGSADDTAGLFKKARKRRGARPAPGARRRAP